MVGFVVCATSIAGGQAATLRQPIWAYSVNALNDSQGSQRCQPDQVSAIVKTLKPLMGSMHLFNLIHNTGGFPEVTHPVQVEHH